RRREAAHRLLVYLADHHAGNQALVVGVAAGLDRRHDQPLAAVGQAIEMALDRIDWRQYESDQILEGRLYARCGRRRPCRDGGRLLIALELADDQLDGLRAGAALDLDVDGLADIGLGDEPGQIVHLHDRLAVEGGDDVARPEETVRGPGPGDVGDQRAVRIAKPQAGGDVV